MKDEVQVPVKDEDGEEHLEPLHIGGKQSDGSMWTRPIQITDPNHDHYFVMEHPGARTATCSCGFSGQIYPHNATLKDGHIYNLKHEKVI